VALGATLVAAVPPLEVRGNRFVNPKTGDQFQVVGVAYQPGGSAGYNPVLGFDPLSNGTNCKRDAALMQILGVNTIRVYNLSPDLNHDECASIFNAAGMYMMLDVNSPLVGESLKADEPWTTYTPAYLNRSFAIVEAFKSYPNTLAFFSGNEVISEATTVKTAPPYVRAVTRDLKEYIAKNADRPIPVGYSAADVRDVLFESWNYFRCTNGAGDTSVADIFALNSYSWCGASSFQTSGYDKLVAGFTGSNVPIFYSEFGCNQPAPRIFTEIPAIYGPDMTGVFSGGIVYEYVQEANSYGLVSLNKDGSAQLLPDYNTLKAQYAKVDFTKVQSVKAAGAGQTPAAPRCEAKLVATRPDFNGNFTLPTLPETRALIDNGVRPRPVGRIVSIADYSVKATVKNVDGSVISNLAVVPLAADASNKPGTNTGSTAGAGGNPAGSAPAAPTESKNAAAAVFYRHTGQSPADLAGLIFLIVGCVAGGGMTLIFG